MLVHASRPFPAVAGRRPRRLAGGRPARAALSLPQLPGRLRGVALRVRPGLLLGDAARTAPRPAAALGPVLAAVAARGLPSCAVLVVAHRPVPVPHAGATPAPRCL
ncbi:hypothetical protein DUI70_2025 [Streptomyces albus]|nr:hypothetical protein DUI70_2025 [Streptomyces albus]